MIELNSGNLHRARLLRPRSCPRTPNYCLLAASASDDEKAAAASGAIVLNVNRLQRPRGCGVRRARDPGCSPTLPLFLPFHHQLPRQTA